MRIKLALLLAALALALIPIVLSSASSLALEEADLTAFGQVYEINRGADGQLYISDYGAQELWRVDPVTGAYTVYAVGRVTDAKANGAGDMWWADAADGFGTMPVTGDTMTSWMLGDGQQLNGVAFDDSGHVWLSEWFGGSSKLYRFDPDTTEMCAYALPGGSYSYYLLHDSGYFWLINWFNGRIARFEPAARQVSQWKIDAPSASPLGLALDANGHLWWADSSAALSRLDPSTDQRTRYALPAGAGSSVEMVEARGSRVWYTESGSGTAGALDPSIAAGTVSTLTTSAATLPEPTCSTLGAGATAAVTTSTGTLSWSSATLNPIVDADGWQVYPLAAGAEPFGIALSGRHVWLTDPGRQKIARIAAPREGALSLTVTPSVAAAHHGDPVTYSYALTYASIDESSAASIALADDTCTPITFVGGDGDGDGELDVTETWTYRCSYTLPAHADGEANPLVNTATASGTDVDGVAAAPGQDSASVTLLHREGTLALEVLPSDSEVSHGDILTYSYNVTYSSPDNAPATNVTVTDTICSPVTGPDPAGDTNGNTYLDVDEVWVYNCQYTVPEHAEYEVNPIVNKATANGTDLDGDTLTPAEGSASVVIREERKIYLPCIVRF
jgi:streptogramin lyase